MLTKKKILLILWKKMCFSVDDRKILSTEIIL